MSGRSLSHFCNVAATFFFAPPPHEKDLAFLSACGDENVKNVIKGAFSKRIE